MWFLGLVINDDETHILLMKYLSVRDVYLALFAFSVYKAAMKAHRCTFIARLVRYNVNGLISNYACELGTLVINFGSSWVAVHRVFFFSLWKSAPVQLELKYISFFFGLIHPLLPISHNG